MINTGQKRMMAKNLPITGSIKTNDNFSLKTFRKSLQPFLLPLMKNPANPFNTIFCKAFTKISRSMGGRNVYITQKWPLCPALSHRVCLKDRITTRVWIDYKCQNMNGLTSLIAIQDS